MLSLKMGMSSLRRLNRSHPNETCFSSINTPCNHDDRYSIPVPAVITFLITVLVTGLAGNAIVVMVISFKRKMRTFTNVLILNLAFADLLVALFCIPLEIPLELNHKWIYGKIFCRIFYPIQSATVYGSVFTLVALSLSRYWAILHPYCKQPGRKNAKQIIIIIWTLAVILVIPYSIGLKYDESDRECKEVWNTTSRKIFTLATFLLQYIIPLTIMIIAYSCIIHEMIMKKKISYTDKERYDEGRKLIKLLLIVTITFALCTLPFHVIAFSHDFADANSFPYIEDVSLLSYLLLYLNSSLNPIIYNTFSSNFRQVFSETYDSIVNYLRKLTKTGSKGKTKCKRSTKVSYYSAEKGNLKLLMDFDKMRETIA